jgi:hypothetical protein
MISGYLKSQQDLVDLLNGYLFSKVGVLELFLGANLVSMYVERGFIKGFKLVGDERLKVDPKNRRSALMYHLCEFMDHPEAFFTFREGKGEDLLELKEPMGVDELVLQLQLVHGELKGLLDKVITPYAVVKVIKSFEGQSLYDGASVYEIIVNSERNIVEEIRRLKTLFADGSLDINQFYNPEVFKDEVSVEYVMKDIDINKISLSTFLENFQLSKFTGVVVFFGADFEYELYYKKGKLVSIHPCSAELFDFILSPYPGTKVNVISLGSKVLDLLALRHSENKAMQALSGSFIELGKVLMGMNLEKKTGLITVYPDGYRMHILYRDGLMVGVIEEKAGDFKKVARFHFDKAKWLDLTFYRSVENIKNVVYLFLINVIHSIILRNAAHLQQSIMFHLASSDTLKYHEGSIVYRKEAVDEEEVANFLQFLLDMSYTALGQERFEQELETVLEPYKEIIKLLNIEEYLRFSTA